MNILVLKPRPHQLDWTLFTDGRRSAVISGHAGGCRGAAESRETFHKVIDLAVASAGESATLDAVAVRLPFGGPEFTGPVIATADVLARLDAIADDAPLHLPPALALIRAVRDMRPDLCVVLLFETSFFADLPVRERLYALEDKVGGEGLRRYGFHGVYHEAACRHASREMREWHGSASPCVAGFAEQGSSAPKVLSVCLEPRPEIAGAIGTRAVTATSGATPLEGLPGRTSCGEIDPSIVLTLAEELKLGAEEIDALLTRESGLLGLVGSPATLEDVFISDDPVFALARDVMRYRMLLAAGGAVSALGGLDAIVFSGRSAKLGRVIGPWLIERLKLRGAPAGKRIECLIFTEPLDRLIADTASAVVLRRSTLPTCEPA